MSLDKRAKTKDFCVNLCNLWIIFKSQYSVRVCISPGVLFAFLFIQLPQTPKGAFASALMSDTSYKLYALTRDSEHKTMEP